MILSDKSIEAFLEDGDLYVDPEPTAEQVQPASLDVRLGREMYLVAEDDRYEADTHRLLPGERYLGHTKERVGLPDALAAQLAGRSSIGRRGVIVHKTAGWIDPGFTGQITLELMNMGDQPVVLDEGERVAQLVFFPLDRPSRGYDGSYQHQNGATEAYQN